MHTLFLISCVLIGILAAIGLSIVAYLVYAALSLGGLELKFLSEDIHYMN